VLSAASEVRGKKKDSQKETNRYDREQSDLDWPFRQGSGSEIRSVGCRRLPLLAGDERDLQEQGRRTPEADRVALNVGYVEYESSEAGPRESGAHFS